MSITLSEFGYGVTSILYLNYGLDFTQFEENMTADLALVTITGGEKLTVNVRCSCGKRGMSGWSQSPLEQWSITDALWQIACVGREVAEWLNYCRERHEEAVA